MLKTVKDACKPHPSVFEDDPLDNIDDLARAFAEGREAEEFFERSYLTSGTRDLFDLGLRRLAGRSDQAVFELPWGDADRFCRESRGGRTGWGLPELIVTTIDGTERRPCRS
jgi:hypothetical protein